MRESGGAVRWMIARALTRVDQVAGRAARAPAVAVPAAAAAPAAATQRRARAPAAKAAGRAERRRVGAWRVAVAVRSCKSPGVVAGLSGKSPEVGVARGRAVLAEEAHQVRVLSCRSPEVGAEARSGRAVGGGAARAAGGAQAGRPARARPPWTSPDALAGARRRRWTAVSTMRNLPTLPISSPPARPKPFSPPDARPVTARPRTVDVAEDLHRRLATHVTVRALGAQPKLTRALTLCLAPHPESQRSPRHSAASHRGCRQRP